MKVLIAEDDPATRAGLTEILTNEGYQVVTAADGLQAWSVFENTHPDLVCLDIMMPGRDGYELCKKIRASGATTPVIFISAKGTEIDKVLGLELGADDFIVKPFGVREVVARVRAVTRRCLARVAATAAPGGPDPLPGEPFTLGPWHVNPHQLRASRGESAIDLSLREVRILALFARNPGKVLDRNTIFNHCWGEEHLPGSRTLDQHVAQLRKRLEDDPRNPTLIKTVHGAGYRWEP